MTEGAQGPATGWVVLIYRTKGALFRGQDREGSGNRVKSWLSGVRRARMIGPYLGRVVWDGCSTKHSTRTRGGNCWT